MLVDHQLVEWLLGHILFVCKAPDLVFSHMIYMERTSVNELEC